MFLIQKSIVLDEILLKCKNKDKTAQNKLFEKLAPRMLGICFRYIADRSEAEHIMIGGMVKVFDKMDQYQGDSPFEAWVRRIMINECLMYLRKTKKMTLLETSLDTYEEKIAGHWPEDSIDSEVLVGLIQSLPLGYRSVFNLYAIEGYSHAEVAEMLQISVNTSKSQLSRARSFLQKRLVALNIQKPKNHRNEII